MQINSQQAAVQKPPIVSIGMPVYNGENYIRQALDSLLTNTFSEFEVIISDNASTDETKNICLEYARKDARIRYIRQPSNIGAYNNFSFVVNEAVGKYFSWLAHDDVLKANFLSECADYLDKNEAVALVTGDFLAVDGHGNELEVKQLAEIRPTIPWRIRAAEFYRIPVRRVFLCVYGLMRRDVLQEVLCKVRKGPFLSASELPLLSRFAARAQIASLPSVLRLYRYHEKSAFHSEYDRLLSSPIKGRLMRIYNRSWHRLDQLMVLMGSSYSIYFKFHVVYLVVKFNVANMWLLFRDSAAKLVKARGE